MAEDLRPSPRLWNYHSDSIGHRKRHQRALRLGQQYREQYPFGIVRSINPDCLDGLLLLERSQARPASSEPGPDCPHRGSTHRHEVLPQLRHPTSFLGYFLLQMRGTAAVGQDTTCWLTLSQGTASAIGRDQWGLGPTVRLQRIDFIDGQRPGSLRLRFDAIFLQLSAGLRYQFLVLHLRGNSF